MGFDDIEIKVMRMIVMMRGEKCKWERDEGLKFDYFGK